MPMGVGLWYNPKNEKVFNIANDGSGTHEVWIAKPQNAEEIGLSKIAQQVIEKTTDVDEIRMAAIRDGLVRTREYKNYVSVTLSGRRGLRDLLYKIYNLIKSRYSPYAYVKIHNIATGENVEIHMPDYKNRLSNDEPILFKEDTNQHVHDTPQDPRILKLINTKLAILEQEAEKYILNENGLSRIYAQTKKHDYGTITAFRGTYNTKENRARNKSLLSKLRSKRYSVTSISGKYIENINTPQEQEVSEDSYLVVDVLDTGNLRQDLMQLGQQFEQDTILYGNAGEQSVLIGTSKRKDAKPAFGQEELQGGAIFGKKGELMSRVKNRPFVFDQLSTSYDLLRYPTELRSQVAESKKHWTDLLNQL